MDAIEKKLLEEVADLHGIPEGAYNIRADGKLAGRNTTAHINIVTKEDKPGIDIYIAPGTKNESVHIPVIISQTGLKDMVYNDFYIGEDCDVTIVAGCGIHNCGTQESRHDGIHTFYLAKNAKLRYSTIENWSKNMYNLNTKRALVEEGGVIEWVSGSFGSHVGCLYPMSVLKGDNSKMEFTGVTFAGAGQNLDTGAKVVHIGKNTSSYMNTRSISKSGGISTFRSSVVVQKGAKHAKSSVSCQSLMLDSESRSDTVPAMDIRTKDTAVGHEAKIGSISNEAVFYLMSRGMSEEDARALIVSGFADNVSKELPLEYAVEMNNLIRLEMKGSIG